MRARRRVRVCMLRGTCVTVVCGAGRVQVATGVLWCVVSGAYVLLRGDTMRFLDRLLSREADQRLLLVPRGSIVPRARAARIVPDAQVMSRGRISYKGAVRARGVLFSIVVRCAKIPVQCVCATLFHVCCGCVRAVLICLRACLFVPMFSACCKYLFLYPHLRMFMSFVRACLRVRARLLSVCAGCASLFVGALFACYSCVCVFLRAGRGLALNAASQSRRRQ